MTRSTLGAFALLILAGCSQTGTDINSKYGDMHGSAKRVSGSAISDCPDTVFGLDDDQDGYTIVPASWTDIFADNASGYADYVCIDLVVSGAPKHYIEITSDSMVGTDCDDANSAVGTAGSATYADEDGDGFGAGVATMVCTLSEGDITDNTDCDDSSETAQYTFPGAAEFDSTTLCEADTDSDGYGDSAIVEGIAAGTDCDDETYVVNPGATETCNGVDDNCAGGIDDGLTFVLVYPDLDADGFGDDSSAGTSVCDGADTLESLDNTDCDDDNSGINTGAAEIADNAVDENCDGTAYMTPATVYPAVCATGAQVTDSCVLYLSDTTVYPYTPDDPGWWTSIYASGTGEICTTAFPVVSGNAVKVNLECNNGSVVYWGWMNGGVVNASTFSVGGTDLLSSVVNTPYDEDSDGDNDGADGIVTIP